MRVLERPAGGWLTVELLVVLVLAGFFATVLFQTSLSLQRQVGHWDRTVRMRQALCATLFLLARDVRMAGCNPLQATTFQGLQVEESGNVTRLVIRMDTRGTVPGSWPDGDANDPDERIEYRLNQVDGVLRRNGQPVMLGIADNTDGTPLFRAREAGTSALLEVALLAGQAGDTLGQSTWVQIRNPR